MPQSCFLPRAPFFLLPGAYPLPYPLLLYSHSRHRTTGHHRSIVVWVAPSVVMHAGGLGLHPDTKPLPSPSDRTPDRHRNGCAHHWPVSRVLASLSCLISLSLPALLSPILVGMHSPGVAPSCHRRPSNPPGYRRRSPAPITTLNPTLQPLLSCFNCRLER